MRLRIIILPHFILVADSHFSNSSPHLWGCLLRLCCTNGVRESLFESSVVAGEHEQLVPYDVQDQEERSFEAVRICLGDPIEVTFSE